MNFVENQKQHKVPKVYLKQFGYELNGQSWVTVMERGNPRLCGKSIESFLTEINVFDLPFTDTEMRRSFEQFNGKLETRYPSLIEEIKKSNKLSDKGESLLFQVVSNFIMRTDCFRSLILQFLKSKSRASFLNEMLGNLNPKQFEKVTHLLNLLKPENQINTISPIVMDYLFRILASYYQYVIVRDYDNRGWFTTDDPAMLFNYLDYDYAFHPVKTEIIFPLSRDYLLYIYNDANDDRILPELDYKNYVFQNADDKLHEKIINLIGSSESLYMIMPCHIERGTRLDN